MVVLWKTSVFSVGLLVNNNKSLTRAYATDDRGCYVGGPNILNPLFFSIFEKNILILFIIFRKNIHISKPNYQELYPLTLKNQYIIPNPLIPTILNCNFNLSAIWLENFARITHIYRNFIKFIPSFWTNYIYPQSLKNIIKYSYP